MSDQEPVGSLGVEAARLLRALTAETSHGAPATGEHVCTTTWCPVCQIVGYVREHPEAVEQVTDSAVHLVRSVRDLLDPDPDRR